MNDFKTWWYNYSNKHYGRLFVMDLEDHTQAAYEAGKAEGFDSGRNVGLQEAHLIATTKQIILDSNRPCFDICVAIEGRLT